MLCSFPSKHTDHFFFLSCLMLFLAEVTHPPGPLFTAQGSLSQAEYTGRVPMWRASARVPCCSSTNNPRDTVAATAEEVRGFKLQLTNCCISSTLGQNKQKKNATHNTRQTDRQVSLPAVRHLLSLLQVCWMAAAGLCTSLSLFEAPPTATPPLPAGWTWTPEYILSETVKIKHYRNINMLTFEQDKIIWCTIVIWSFTSCTRQLFLLCRIIFLRNYLVT